MSEKRTIKVVVKKGERPHDSTDWEKLRAMTEEEIHAGALSDPDNPPLTEDELARFKPVRLVKRAKNSKTA